MGTMTAAAGSNATVADLLITSGASQYLSDSSLSHLDTYDATNSIVAALLTILVSSIAFKVHSKRVATFESVPRAWRATKDAPLGLSDGPIRRIRKSLVTAALVLILPLQVAIVGCSIFLQTSLFYLGFGGGRPGTPAFPAVPVQSPEAWWNPVARLFFYVRDASAKFAAKYLLHDERNAPFLPWMAYLAFVTPTLFGLAAYYHVTTGQYAPLTHQIGAVFAYRVLMMGPYFKFFAHGATLIHKEGHANKTRRGLFKGPLGRVLNHVMEWWVAFFYGHVPENYRVGHVEVHHGEGNDFGDVSSTLFVDRSKEGSFLTYLGDFAEFWSNLTVVEWFDRHIAAGTATPKMCADRKACIRGMVAYYGAFFVLYATLGPWFAFFYYLEPHMEVINYLTAINYTWHAFADPDDHSNEYVKSITILEGHYKVFGEDFHVEHHLRPGVHWTEMEATYHKKKATYAENKATVFSDTMEFELFVMILLGDMNALAEKFVDLHGTFPTHGDKKAELLRRMRPVLPEVSAKEGTGGNHQKGWSTNTRASTESAKVE